MNRAGQARPFDPHDLLWVADGRALQAPAPLPRWADAAWMAQSPLVVRRERVASTNLVPVGLRGRLRNERFAAYLEAGAVLRQVKPEMLARAACRQRLPGMEHLPAAIALARVAPLLDASGLRWGPTGSMGYALASGLPALRPESDLDLLVRANTPFTPAQVQALQSLPDDHGCRIDLQVDTGHGGFALVEWLRDAGRVLLKTGRGPFLTGDPWNQTGWLDSVETEAA